MSKLDYNIWHVISWPHFLREQIQARVNVQSSGLHMVVLGLSCLPAPHLPFLTAPHATYHAVGVELVTHRAQVKRCVAIPTKEHRLTQAGVCVLLQPSSVLVPSKDSLLPSCFSWSQLTLKVLAHFHKMLSHSFCLCAYLTESYIPSKTFSPLVSLKL